MFNLYFNYVYDFCSLNNIISYIYLADAQICVKLLDFSFW